MANESPHVTESFGGQKEQLAANIEKLRQALLGSHVGRIAQKLRRMVQRKGT